LAPETLTSNTIRHVWPTMVSCPSWVENTGRNSQTVRNESTVGSSPKVRYRALKILVRTGFSRTKDSSGPFCVSKALIKRRLSSPDVCREKYAPRALITLRDDAPCSTQPNKNCDAATMDLATSAPTRSVSATDWKNPSVSGGTESSLSSKDESASIWRASS